MKENSSQKKSWKKTIVYIVVTLIPTIYFYVKLSDDTQQKTLKIVEKNELTNNEILAKMDLVLKKTDSLLNIKSEKVKQTTKYKTDNKFELKKHITGKYLISGIPYKTKAKIELSHVLGNQFEQATKNLHGNAPIDDSFFGNIFNIKIEKNSSKIIERSFVLDISEDKNAKKSFFNQKNIKLENYKVSGFINFQDVKENKLNKPNPIPFMIGENTYKESGFKNVVYLVNGKIFYTKIAFSEGKLSLLWTDFKRGKVNFMPTYLIKLV